MRIDEISDEDKPHLERIRGEILDVVTKRSEQETQALNRLTNFMAVICSGSTIAILGFIGQKVATGIPVWATLSFFCFSGALLSFAFFLYFQFQIHSKRWSVTANTAQSFFGREAELEDVLEAMRMYQSKWSYRCLFWVPFSFMILGFLLSFAGLSVTGTAASKGFVNSPDQPQQNRVK